MQYNSWLYLFAFLAGTVLLYYLVPVRGRWWVLLGASLGFYWISSRKLLVVLLLTSLVIYAGGFWLGRNKDAFRAKKSALDKAERHALKEKLNRKNRFILAVCCVLAFGVLFTTKYFNFFGANLNLLFQSLSCPAHIPILRLMMPLGISFYTLSAVSYLVDVSNGTCRVQKRYGKLLLFLVFFPVIVEGPISRYSQLGEQLAEGHRFDYTRFCFGLQLMTWGLFQKVVLADRLNLFVGNIFDHAPAYSGSVVAVAILAYTFQIYTDFCGCMDIARGSAELFGIQLALNFRQPFFAVTVNDFWRRWHITLGAWLRDYIFYPLSMSKGFQRLAKAGRKLVSPYYASVLPMLLALLAVWFGNGIWHGAAWKYIVYGLYYYCITAIGLLLEPAFRRLLAALHLNRKQKGYRLWQILRTFALVNLGMLIFRADTLHTAWAMFTSLFRASGQNLLTVITTQGLPTRQFAIILFGAAVVFIISILRERGVSLRPWLARRPLPLRWIVYLASVAFVLCFGAYGPGFGVVDFIYAQF